eukprot:16113332-Heterocapsa_arctica.AAC.1
MAFDLSDGCSTAGQIIILPGATARAGAGIPETAIIGILRQPLLDLVSAHKTESRLQQASISI